MHADPGPYGVRAMPSGGLIRWDAWGSLELLKETARALQFLHDNGIVHGDLKGGLDGCSGLWGFGVLVALGLWGFGGFKVLVALGFWSFGNFGALGLGIGCCIKGVGYRSQAGGCLLD